MLLTEFCAGVDEVGRGPLAGAVFAAAVVLDPWVSISGLRDSKQLSARARERLDAQIKARSIGWAIARSEVEEIDRLNILQASLLAMQRAVAMLSCRVDYAVIDGNRVPDLPCPAEYLVKGDGKLDCIKAASIIAKVARDEEMQRLDVLYPEYGLAQHKGYPTRVHLDALRRHGPSSIHRMSFGPCRQKLPKKKPRSDRGST